MQACNAPCKSCPWRKTSKVGGSGIPNFDIKLMRNLCLTTAPAKNDVSDGFRKIMACHSSKPGQEFPCAGYIAVHGHQNINVRMLVSQGQLDYELIKQNCENIELYPDFHTMLSDYEAALKGSSNGKR